MELPSSIAAILEDPAFVVRTASASEPDAQIADLYSRLGRGAHFSEALLVPSDGLVLVEPPQRGRRSGVYYPHTNCKTPDSAHAAATLVFDAGAKYTFRLVEILMRISCPYCKYMKFMGLDTPYCTICESHK